MLLPESTWILVIVCLGIGVIVRLISTRTAFSVIGVLVLISLFEPILGALFESLPLWLLILVIIIFGLTTISWLMSLLVGKSTTDHFKAMILHDIFLLPFRLIGMLFRRR